MDLARQIEECIFEGVKATCIFACDLEGIIEAKFKPEYALTIGIAQSLIKLNYKIKEPFTIKLEEPTQKFFTSCVPETDGKWNFCNEHDSEKRHQSKKRRKKNENEKGRGRIDIVVYDKYSNKHDSRFISKERGLFPIEVKGFNCQYTPFIKDIKRLIELFEISDTNTGNSILEKAYFVSIEEVAKFKLSENKEKTENDIKSKYEKRLNKLVLRMNGANISHNVMVQTIQDRIYSSIDNDMEYEIGDYNDEHHFIGVVIVLTKVKKLNEICPILN